MRLSLRHTFTRQAIMLCSLMTLGCSAKATDEAQKAVFANEKIEYELSFSTMATAFWNTLTSDTPDLYPSSALPLQSLSHTQLVNETENVIYRLGHSSVLIHLNDQWILTDPIFSQRASPFQWAGPERFHPSPVSINDLPEIDMVLISHNHFDHLDQASIEQLAPKTKCFAVPSGLKPLLIDWGIPPEKVTALEWWQHSQIDHLTLTFTPAQHYSGRGIGDKNATLWGGWIIDSPPNRLYFSGDTGYYDLFKRIGDQYGPFDVALIEDGQYNHNWPVIHMFPEQVVQANLDLKSRVLFPIHNSTFKLADHSWYEPLAKTKEIGLVRQVEMAMPEFGQRYKIGEHFTNPPWWDLK